jgi:hypothetical protein
MSRLAHRRMVLQRAKLGFPTYNWKKCRKMIFHGGASVLNQMSEYFDVFA